MITWCSCDSLEHQASVQTRAVERIWLQWWKDSSPFTKKGIFVTLGLISFSSRQYFDLAADVLAENAHLTYKFLTPVSCCQD